MRELRRVTAPGGWCLVMVPLALDRATHLRGRRRSRRPRSGEREFLQHDHVRLYAPDIAERLRAAGFGVEVIDLHAELGPQAPRATACWRRT